LLGGAIPPANNGERQSLCLAFGLALSQSAETTNFLHTYGQKELTARATRTNLAILQGLAVIALLLAGFYYQSHRQLNNKRETLAEIQTKITAAANLDVASYQSLLTARTVQIKKTEAEHRELARRYYPVSLVGEIIAMLPAEVRLLDLTIAAAEQGNSAAAFSAAVRIEGIVTGDERNMQLILAGLLRQLSTSPLVHGSSLAKQEPGEYEGLPALHFEIAVETGLADAKKDGSKKS